MAKQSVPVRIRRLLIRLAGGETLCKSVAPNGGDLRFWFEPCQKEAPLKTCLDAIAKGYIVPNGDGLFGGIRLSFDAAPHSTFMMPRERFNERVLGLVVAELRVTQPSKVRRDREVRC